MFNVGKLMPLRFLIVLAILSLTAILDLKANGSGIAQGEVLTGPYTGETIKIYYDIHTDPTFIRFELGNGAELQFKDSHIVVDDTDPEKVFVYFCGLYGHHDGTWSQAYNWDFCFQFTATKGLFGYICDGWISSGVEGVWNGFHRIGPEEI